MFNRARKCLSLVKEPVFASHPHGKPTDISTALMVCGSCDTKVVGNYSLAAACPVCAETMAPAKSKIVRRNGKVVTTASGEPRVKTLDFTKADLKKMPIAVTCSECDTDYRSTKELIASMNGIKVGCMVCASTMVIHAEEDEPEVDAETDEDDATDTTMDDTSEDENEDHDDDEDDADEETPVEDEDGEPDEDSDEVEDEIDEPAAAESNQDQGSAADYDETDEDYASGLRTESETAASVRTISIDAFAKARKNKKAELSFVMASTKNPTWYLFANNQPVAYSDREQVKAELVAAFGTPNFGKIFEAATSRSGLTDEVVADFGLTSVVIAQQIDTVQADKIEHAVTSAVAELDAKRSEIKARFDQSVGIAALGINKGLFTDVKNPLREAFIAALASVNVRDSEALVDSVLNQNCAAYTAAIMSKALEIEAKPEAAIAELASIVNTAAYRTTKNTTSSTLIDDLVRGSNTPVIAAYDDKPSSEHVDYKNVFSLGRKGRI